MARNHKAAGQSEPHAARMGELLPSRHRQQSVSGTRQLHRDAVAPVVAVQAQNQASQGRDLSTLASLRALWARTPEQAWARRAVGEGVTFCPRAGCGKPRQLADQGRAILWRDLPCDPGDPASWTRPVIRLGYYGDEPFKMAVNSPVLYSAFDQLVGRGRWRPRKNLGTFPVRFPSPDDPGDAGWHVDVSFPGEDCDPNEQTDFSSWRVNVTSRGRALLMLFLFSDVGERDAPTRIRVGSHFDMA